MTRHKKIPCDNQAQDRWARFYLTAAEAVCRRFGLPGRAAVRDAVRMYGESLGRQRRSFLLENGRKPHLDNLFDNGGPLPCGERTEKEWIRSCPQEVFVNIGACPCAACWNAAHGAEIGKIFCEEFYPAYIFAAVSAKAQVNVGRELVNEGDTFCRISVYFRPANLPVEERGFYFDEFDPAYRAPRKPCPEDGFRYDLGLTLLRGCFARCAGAWLGAEGEQFVESAADAFLQKEGLS